MSDKTYFQLTITKDDKEFLKQKAEELGYKSVSAFVVQCAKNHFVVDIDMSNYRELAREINYIGRNVNSVIRKIHSQNFFSDTDIDFLKRNQEIIIEKLNGNYERLLNMREEYKSGNMSLEEKENFIKYLSENKIDFPKNFVTEKIYERIKNDAMYIFEAIDNSPEQEEGIADYVLEYFYGETIYILKEEYLIEFSDRLFEFVQKLKFKLLNPANCFDDDDWYELKDILDDYEVY